MEIGLSAVIVVHNWYDNNWNVWVIGGRKKKNTHEILKIEIPMKFMKII